ncbi:MAG: hypothetical protein ACE5KE_10135 [Methanosarcinales archaeon]
MQEHGIIYDLGAGVEALWHYAIKQLPKKIPLNRKTYVIAKK